ncbi:hypothetical protein BJD20_20045 [Acinetobacter proteolyticus]|nr:hypothetical protein BJD20_20045 [Acinetobacter proteolyticus]
MASLCETVDEATKACLQWVEYVSVVDQLAITKSDALIIFTPIASTYVILIGWSFLMILYHQNRK